METGSSNSRKKIYYMLVTLIFGLIAIVLAKIMVRCYGLLINMEQEGIIVSSVMGIYSYVLFIKGLLKPKMAIECKTYIPLAAFAIPAIAVYGYNSSKGLLYYLFAAFVFVTLPVIPYAMGEVINKLAFSHLGNKKWKGVVLILLGVFVNFLLSLWGNWSSILGTNPVSKLTEQFMLGENKISDFLAWIFPMNSYGILSLLNGSVKKSMVYFLVYFALVVLFIMLHRVVTKLFSVK